MNLRYVIALWCLIALAAAAADDVFENIDLPDAWESKFWADPAVIELLKLEPKAIAELVPTQAGLHFVRCPACDRSESESDWAWSPAQADVITCKKCKAKLPDDKFPAKDDSKIPEDSVEVLPGVFHHYPYHVVEHEKQKYPDERIYLNAKRDDLKQTFLAKFAFYAAVRNREQPDPKLALDAAIILIKFAQVYPGYATHFDQPARPKYFDRADLKPPYRGGHTTAKWTWTASRNVPINLVIAYALLRETRAIEQAAAVLRVGKPREVIERDLFRSSAEFVLHQPPVEEELGLAGYRGVLAVGRLLNDRRLIETSLAESEKLWQSGFSFDGLWRGVDGAEHRRVLNDLDGWIGMLNAGHKEPPIILIARTAGSPEWSTGRDDAVRQASWPTVETRPRTERRPRLLGGSGIARLSVGSGAEGLDVELRSPGRLGSPYATSLAMRMAVGSRPILGDLDDREGTLTGFERSTVSHNSVVVDGLNQGESPTKAAIPVLGADPLFFAADPDFQVAQFDDPRAYPTSAQRYRQTLVAGLTGGTPYILSVFEVHGGLQHDQILHGVGSATWQWSAEPLKPVKSLLAPGISFLSNAKRDDGRWFVQSFGEFQQIQGVRVDRPAMVGLGDSGRLDLRVHLFSDLPINLMTATSPSGDESNPEKSALILRRKSQDGGVLNTVFVSVFEPGGGVHLKKVGRVVAEQGQVVILLEGTSGPEHLIVSLEPGKIQKVKLGDGRGFSFDGHVARVSSSSAVTFAGGTFAELDGVFYRRTRLRGQVVSIGSESSETGRGWIETDLKLPVGEELRGRVLRVGHADGTTRGWTIVSASMVNRTTSRFELYEDVGFTIDVRNGSAKYYHFPHDVHSGPHKIDVDLIYRTTGKNF